MKKFVMSMVLILLATISVSAEGIGRVRVGGGNWVYEGGINSFNGIECKSEKETKELEKKLQKRGYVLVNTDDREITDTEYDVLCKIGFTFADYLNPNNIFKWTHSKVYFDKNSLKRLMKSKDCIDDMAFLEAETSTVILDYGYWYSKAMAGKLSDQYGDNIPVWDKTGYVKMISTEDIQVVLHNIGLNVYFSFTIKKDEPYVVRMISGNYQVVEINGLGFDDEKALPNNNNITIGEQDKDAPYEIDFSEVVEKYGIKKTDNKEYKVGKKYEQPSTKKVIVVDTEQKKETKKDVKIAVIGIVGTLLLILVIAIIRNRKRR